MIAYVLLLIASSTPAAAIEATSAPATVESARSAFLPALLIVHESEGCSDDGNGDALVQEFHDGQALFRQRIGLTLPETVTQGGVLVTRDGNRLRAEVETVVLPVRPGNLLPACIRPV
ncbi:MAG: hypothetical protein ABI538_11855 [Pseudoxanthomonas sp.]